MTKEINIKIKDDEFCKIIANNNELNKQIEESKISSIKTADEMFEELGYKKSKNNISGNICFYNKYRDTIIYDVSDCTIIFTRSMSTEELKAINKKCEELRVVIMNSELWCYKGQERQTLINWLVKNKVEFEENMTTEELRQLYIKKECEEI